MEIKTYIFADRSVYRDTRHAWENPARRGMHAPHGGAATSSPLQIL